jgi:hypothetical protein
MHHLMTSANQFHRPDLSKQREEKESQSSAPIEISPVISTVASSIPIGEFVAVASPSTASAESKADEMTEQHSMSIDCSSSNEYQLHRSILLPRPLSSNHDIRADADNLSSELHQSTTMMQAESEKIAPTASPNPKSSSILFPTHYNISESANLKLSPLLRHLGPMLFHSAIEHAIKFEQTLNAQVLSFTLCYSFNSFGRYFIPSMNSS